LVIRISPVGVGSRDIGDMDYALASYERLE
jgi:hypothetical protein